MPVKRIVANIGAAEPSAAHAFYGELLGLDLVMDHGWILTFAAEGSMTPQVSVAREGGSGTPVPDLSIEVDDWNELWERVSARGIAFEYGPVDEPWGVRRFFIRDPFGRLVNVLEHR